MSSPEHTLWAAVASRALEDEKLILATAREGKRSLNLDGHRVALQTPAEELARIRRYFTSSDWEAVASRAGLDSFDADRALDYICNTEGKRIDRRSLK